MAAMEAVHPLHLHQVRPNSSMIMGLPLSRALTSRCSCNTQRRARTAGPYATLWRQRVLDVKPRWSQATTSKRHGALHLPGPFQLRPT